MERLTLPRARAEPDGVQQPIPEARSPLPRWQTIPLDAKFPVLPAPKGEVTFVTTKMGETPYKSSQKKDFDLSDPYNRTINTEYKALFDPYLKGWFSKPHIQKQMRKQNLLTERGNVPCSVRDFNEYRLFLRKQALLKGGSKFTFAEKDFDHAKERRQAFLTKTKMRAEVFGVEVKYRSLKAQQTIMEQEEEKRNKYLKKSASQEERQKEKVMAEEKEYFKALMQSQNTWGRKLDKIKEREMAMRRNAEQKLVRFELEAQDKLNKLDYLREQRFQALDQRRKYQWRMRRLHQMQEMQEAKLQRQRVDAEMRTIKRRYENQITRRAAFNEVALDNAKEARCRMKERDSEAYARRMAQVLKNTRYITFGSSEPNAPSGSARASRAGESQITRHASVWMVQEVLLRLGLSEESRRLKKQHFSNVSYMSDLDQALSTAVRRLEGTTLLGAEQEMLSRLAHLVWRGVKTAYPGKTAPVRVPTNQSLSQGFQQSATLKTDEGEGLQQGGGGEDEAEDRSKMTVEGEGEDDALQWDSQMQLDEDGAPIPSQLSSKDQAEAAERTIMESSLEDDLTTAEQLAWFFPDNDDALETEQAVKISLLITGEMERQLPLPTILGDARPKLNQPQRRVDERMDQFFKTRMRMTETDALAMEDELIRFLDSLKESDLNPKEMKKILDMCIRLANHDVIQRSDPCGELETNPDGHVFLAFDPNDAKSREELDIRTSSIIGVGLGRKSSAGTGKETTMAQRASSSVTSKLDTVQTGEGEAEGESAGEVGNSGLAENPQGSATGGLDAGGGSTVEVARGENQKEAIVEEGGEEVEAPAREEGEDEQTDATENATSRYMNRNLNRNNAKRIRTAEGSETSISRSSVTSSHSGATRTSRSNSSNHVIGNGSRTSVGDDFNTTEDERTKQPVFDQDQNTGDNSSNSSSSTTSRTGRVSPHSDNSNTSLDRKIRDQRKDTELKSTGGIDRGSNINENNAREFFKIITENLSHNMADGGEGEAEDEQDQGEGMPDQMGALEETMTQELAEQQSEQGEDRSSGESRVTSTQDNQAEASATTVLSEDPKEKSEADQVREPKGGLSKTLAESGSSKAMTSGTALGVGINKTEEEMEAIAFEEAVKEDDIVAVAEQMLIKIQEREKSKGVSIPQSRLLRFVAMNLSRLWKPGPYERVPNFGSWLLEPTTPQAIRSLIYNIKRRKFPEELQRNMAKAIVSVFLEGVAGPATPLTDGLVKTILNRFMADLERDEVSLAIMEKVLRAMAEEYTSYIRTDLTFNASVLVLDCLGFLQDLIVSGEVNKRQHLLPAVRNLTSLPMDSKDTLECGRWSSLMHQATVAIRLDLLSEADQKNLLELIRAVCIEHLPADTIQDTKEMLDMIRNLNTIRANKVAFSIDLGVNVAVLLLGTIQKSKITSTTLLPGAQNTSQSACTDRSASVLGPYSTAEAVIILTLDKLASDMGHGSMAPDVQAEIAASLVEVLVTQHGRRRDELKGEGLSQALDQVSSQLESLALNFRELKGIFAAILRPYLSTTVRPLLVLFTSVPEQDDPPQVPLEEGQSKSLLALITQVFVSFVLGIITRAKRTGVNVDKYSRKIMSLYVWRAVAYLAKQAKLVLTEMENDLKNETVTNKVKPSDSLVIERILRTVVDMGEAPGLDEVPQTPSDPFEDGNGHRSVSSGFIRAILNANPKPGYIAVPNTGSRSFTRKSSMRRTGRDTMLDMEYSAEEWAQRSEKTPVLVDRAVRREIIAAARDIGDSLISTKALRELTTKTADSFAGMVFVTEKLMDKLFNKLWALCRKLQRGKMSPDILVSTMIGPEQCDDLPELKLDRDSAVKVLQEATLELEAHHASALTMSRMVESLSRAAQGLVPGSDATAAQLRSQPHPILASASPLLLAQWVRACLLSALRSVTTVISGGRRSSAMMPRKPVVEPPIATSYSSVSERRSTISGPTGQRKPKRHEVDLDAIQLAASYVVVHNLLAQVRMDAEHNKGPDNLWLPPRVAGTQERSQVGVPYEILDRVFARLAGVMQTLADSGNEGPEDNDGRVPEKFCDLASTLISQVTGAVSYHVEVGKFPFIRINDLLNAGNSAKHKIASSMKTPAATKQLGKSNNNWNEDMNFSSCPQPVQDPVAMMKARWSGYLFRSLMDVVSRMDATLKDAIEDSMQRQESVTTDARVRARAFTSAMLEKIRKHSSSQELLLHCGLEMSNAGMLGTGWADPAAALGTTPSAIASPAVSRKPSQARVGAKYTRTPSGNANANKSRNVFEDHHKPPVANTGKCVAPEAKSTPLMNYVRSLLRPVKDSKFGDIFGSQSISGATGRNNKLANGGGNVSNNKSVDIISEVLRAGYCVSLDLFQAFERQPSKMFNGKSAVESSGTRLHHLIDGGLNHENSGNASISILVLDMLLGNLTDSLEHQDKCVKSVASSNTMMGSAGLVRKIGGSADSPYVSSYQYRTPNPLGRYYAEVVDRGRRWCHMKEVNQSSAAGGAGSHLDIPRIHSLTRDLLAPRPVDRLGQSPQGVSAHYVTTTPVSSSDSLTSEPSSTKHRARAEETPGPNSGRRRQGNQQDRERRSCTWRKEVHKVSAAYAADNFNNSWRIRSRTKSADKKVNPMAVSESTGHRESRLTSSKTSATSRYENQSQKSSTICVSNQIRPINADGHFIRKTSGESAGDKKPAVGSGRSADQRGRQAAPRLRGGGSGSIGKRSQLPGLRSGSVRAEPNTCAAPFSRCRASSNDISSNGKSRQTPETPSLAWGSDRQPTPQGDGLRDKKPPPRRQEPRVEVIYHVAERDVAQAQEQLKRFIQSECDVADVPALSDLDLQLLVLTLLSRDLPRETSIMAACLTGSGRLKLSGLEDMADLLSLFDHVLAELGEDFPSQSQRCGGGVMGEKNEGEDGRNFVGLKAKVKRLLKTTGKKLEVSQRSAGAVHSLLRSLECGLLEDASIATGLQTCSVKVTEKLPSMDLKAVRNQLKSSLAQLVERLEEGHAPSSLTSSDWTRLTYEIVRVLKQPPVWPEEDIDLHQSPSHCSKYDDNDDFDEGNRTDCDDMNSAEYRGVPSPKGERAINREQNPDGARIEVEMRDSARSASQSHSRSRSRSGSPSRSSSRSVTRFTSKSPPRRVNSGDEASSSAQHTEDRSGRHHNLGKESPSKAKAKYEGSWSPNRLPSASSRSSSSSSSSSSLSASSLSSVSSPSTSTSSCSAASRGSGCACSVTSNTAGPAQSQSPLISAPKGSSGSGNKSPF